MSTRDTIYLRLPRPEDLPARNLMRTLVSHYHKRACVSCDFYHQYGVMIVKGDLHEHLSDIMKGNYNPVLFFLLEIKRLIEITEITPMTHRITFLHLPAQEEEELACQEAT